MACSRDIIQDGGRLEQEATVKVLEEEDENLLGVSGGRRQMQEIW